MEPRTGLEIATVSPIGAGPKRNRAPFACEDDWTDPSAVDAMDASLDEDEACSAQAFVKRDRSPRGYLRHRRRASIGTNWNQDPKLSARKDLKTWWPGTESVPLPTLSLRKLLFFRLTRSARTSRSAIRWHKSGTNSFYAGPSLFPGK